MAKNSNFRHYNLNQAKRHQLDVKSFLGVDYSTQKFLVSNGRAIDLKNYVYRDGVIQKRHGVEQLFTVPDFAYIPADFDNPYQPLNGTTPHYNNYDKQVNGIWSFIAEDGLRHTVAHIGKLMYEIKNIGTENMTVEPITYGLASGTIYQLAYEFENFKSSAFVGGNKLWFLGGNKYMCLRFQNDGLHDFVQFFPVENSDHTPIPTTTISITYKNSVVSKRMSLDNVNLLTMWRKNKFITGTGKAEDEKTKTVFYEYTIDSPLLVKAPSDTANITFTLEEQGVIE